MSAERPRGRRAVLTAVVLAVLVAGCSARATVQVTMRADGTGTVRATLALDADAVQAAQAGGATLQQRVRLTDLRQAGWVVSPWVTKPGGGATLTVTKRFQAPGQVSGITRELSGPTGPLRTLTAARDTAWVGLAHRDSVHATVDLGAAQPGVTTDQQLVTSLAGQHVDLNGINLQLLAQLRSSVSVRVVAQLPGSRRAIIIQPGKRQQLDVTATTLDTGRVAFLVAALVLAAVAAFVWWRGRRMTRRRSRARTTAT